MRPLLTTLFLIGLFSLQNIAGQNRYNNLELTNSAVEVTFSSRGIISIVSPGDKFRANPVRGLWGAPVVTYKIADGDWLSLYRGETTMTSLSSEAVDPNSATPHIPTIETTLSSIPSEVVISRPASRLTPDIETARDSVPESNHTSTPGATINSESGSGFSPASEISYNPDSEIPRISASQSEHMFTSGTVFTSGIYTDSKPKPQPAPSSQTSRVVYTDNVTGTPLRMDQTFTLDEKSINWTITLATTMEFPVLIGDLGIPFPWKTPSGVTSQDIFEKGFVKHHYISGDGSFIFFAKPSGEPPFLLVTAGEATHLEYFKNQDSYVAYIHSGRSAETDTAGTWRQQHTTCLLQPAGHEGSSISYSFNIEWADSYDELRQKLYEKGHFDIRVVPGMTLPSDLTAKFSLHTKNRIDSIVPEYRNSTSLDYLGEKTGGHHIYEVGFKRLGENMLTVYYNGGLKTYLEFFSTEPLETLYKKRAGFLVKSQQHRVPDKWYDGLFSIYDMKNSVLRGPENSDGYDYWWGYVLASDDPALCKAPYVAAKNVWYPNRKEIEAVEYYLERFVWGGLQRTSSETPYPYGIYGTPNWMVNRDPVLRAGVKNQNLDKMNIWRSYDYPHIIMLYYHMYQIASYYPDMVSYLDADGYLERAWQTARAYFIYPYKILPWYDTYKWGCYNEVVIEELITALEEKGRVEEAGWLRNEYEKKVKYFIYDDLYPFRSEYAIDRTAFESSYAFARYGVQNSMKPDTNLWYDVKLEKWWSHPSVNRDDAREFMDRQHYAGLAVRGWLETKYFLLGSDFTTSSDLHCLSYMAKMGGWSILDYGLRYASDPFDWLQLGYASYLSSWALMNSGTPESEYGYWFPGKENDGAMGWAFMSAKSGPAWIRKNIERGAWFYDGEADLGLGAAFRMASTVLANDPLFGWIAYGGKLETGNRIVSVVPSDGVRSRLWIVDKTERIGIELNRDGFMKEMPVKWVEKKGTIEFIIENRSGGTHKTRLTIISDRIWEILQNGAVKGEYRPGDTFFELEISGSNNITLKRKT